MQCAWIIRIEIVDKVVLKEFLEFVFDWREIEVEIYRRKSIPQSWETIEVRAFGDISSRKFVNQFMVRCWSCMVGTNCDEVVYIEGRIRFFQLFNKEQNFIEFVKHH